MSYHVAIYLSARHPINLTMQSEITLLMSAFAEKALTMVYGGAADGLMGILTQQALQFEVPSIGIMSADLPEETKATQLSRIEIQPTLLERKARMIAISDAFIVLPGGIGTMDEFFSTWCLLRRSLHQQKPIGLLNTSGYFDLLIDFCDQMLAQGMIDVDDRKLLLVDPYPQGLIQLINDQLKQQR